MNGTDEVLKKKKTTKLTTVETIIRLDIHYFCICTVAKFIERRLKDDHNEIRRNGEFEKMLNYDYNRKRATRNTKMT